MTKHSNNRINKIHITHYTSHCGNCTRISRNTSVFTYNDNKQKKTFTSLASLKGNKTLILTSWGRPKKALFYSSYCRRANLVARLLISLLSVTAKKYPLSNNRRNYRKGSYLIAQLAQITHLNI